MTFVFIFLIKQRTDCISLGCDNDKECKGKTGGRGEQPGPTKQLNTSKICIRIVYRQKYTKNFEEALVGVCVRQIKEHTTLKIIPVWVDLNIL